MVKNSRETLQMVSVLDKGSVKPRLRAVYVSLGSQLVAEIK
jgi:hypothetical protein